MIAIDVAVEIEQMHFQRRPAFFMHRRTYPEAGNAAMHAGVRQAGFHHEDAPQRRAVVLELDVGGGETELSSQLVAAHDVARDGIWPAQQPPGAFHVASGQRFPHRRGGGALAVGLDGVHHSDLETLFPARFAHEIRIAGAFGAEAEIVAHQHPARLQASDQDALDELFGRKPGK